MGFTPNKRKFLFNILKRTDVDDYGVETFAINILATDNIAEMYLDLRK